VPAGSNTPFGQRSSSCLAIIPFRVVAARTQPASYDDAMGMELPPDAPDTSLDIARCPRRVPVLLWQIARPGTRLPNVARSSTSTAHSITWSACSSSDCATVSLSALAVLRLMTSSYLVGCSTGRSPGLAPLRILST